MKVSPGEKTTTKKLSLATIPLDAQALFSNEDFTQEALICSSSH
jgi:hypothetical protein